MTNQEIFKNAKIGEWLDCLFIDGETEEEVLVELKKEKGENIRSFVARCKTELINHGLHHMHFVELMSAEEGDLLGLDTY